MQRSDRANSGLWRLLAAVCLSLLAGGNGLLIAPPTAVAAAEDLAKEAATVEEVVKLLDLRTLPLPAGAAVEGERSLGMLNYVVDGDLKSAFAFQQQQLVKAGWKELPGSRAEAAYSMGNFQKGNFIVSVSAYDAGDPDKKGTRITIANLGNVRLSKVPVVKGAKSLFAMEATASYATPLKLAEASTATRKLLTDAGWEPYGSVATPPDSEMLTFKRNAIQLNVFVTVAPAQANQVTISYSESVLSADIPAPADASRVDFADSIKTLNLETSASFDDVATFYQQRLAKMGWKSTSEQFVKDQDQFRRPTGLLFFRNAAKDVLTLDLTTARDKTQAKLTHFSAAEYAAKEKREREAALKLAADRAKSESKSATKPAKSDDGIPDVEKLTKDAIGAALKDAGLDKAKGATKKAASAKDSDAVSVPLPDNAKKVTQTSGNVLQVKFPAGKGKGAAEFIRDQLLAAGWEADKDDKLDKSSGNLTFTKAGKSLTLSYVDAGLADVNLTLIGIGVKLEPGKADPNAKTPENPTKPDTPADSKPAKKTGKTK